MAQATSVTEEPDDLIGGAGGVTCFFLSRGALRGQIFALTDGEDAQAGVSSGVSIFL